MISPNKLSGWAWHILQSRRRSQCHLLVARVPDLTWFPLYEVQGTVGWVVLMVNYIGQLCLFLSLYLFTRVPFSLVSRSLRTQKCIGSHLQTIPEVHGGPLAQGSLIKPRPSRQGGKVISIISLEQTPDAWILTSYPSKSVCQSSANPRDTDPGTGEDKVLGGGGAETATKRGGTTAGSRLGKFSSCCWPGVPAASQ